MLLSILIERERERFDSLLSEERDGKTMMNRSGHFLCFFNEEHPGGRARPKPMMMHCHEELISSSGKQNVVFKYKCTCMAP